MSRHRCKYVTTYAHKSDAKRHARELRASGYRSRVRKHKGGGVEVLACGKRRR